MTFDEILGHLQDVRRQGEHRARARCPAHKDRNPSLSLTRGDDGRILLHCQAGCTLDDVLAAAKLAKQDLFASRSDVPAREITYAYVDENGALVFQVVRKPGKQFRQRRPDGKGGWIYNLVGVRRVPYRLTQINAAPADATVFVVEGEKDADSLARLGLVATTNPGGAANSKLWNRDDFRNPIRGRDVVILPDNDPPGQKHARFVAGALRPSARSVKVFQLPDLPPKGDVSDWIAAGGTKDELLRLALACPVDIVTSTQPEDEPEEERPERPKQAQQLVMLAQSGGQFFRTPDHEAFVAMEVNGHRETWPLRAPGFRRLLTARFFRKQGTAPSENALTEAINTLDALAAETGKERTLNIRVAATAEAVYIDLADKEWNVVKIGENGWTTVPAGDAPVSFRRSNVMLALPQPKPGGTLDDLRLFVNAGNDENYRLIVAWLLFALQPHGPFPVLVLQGEQGSAKSTTARILRALVDPSKAALRMAPKQEADLMIAARNSWLLIYDNLSGVQHWLSDGLCVLATGGAYTTRALYTDAEENVLVATRPVIVNGIDDMATRPDFASRAIVVTLPAIPEDRRREEEEFWREFEEKKAGIFGALCEAVGQVRRLRSGVVLDEHPRMADFARSGVATEQALGWPAGAFMGAYRGNLRESEEVALEADTFASALTSFMDGRSWWEGTSTELLQELSRLVSEEQRDHQWPKKPNKVSSRLRRAAILLRQHGIEADSHRTKNKRSILVTRKDLSPAVTTVTSVIPEQFQAGSDDGKGDGTICTPSLDPAVTMGDETDLGTVTPSAPSEDDAGDGGDDTPSLSCEKREEDPSDDDPAEGFAQEEDPL